MQPVNRRIHTRWSRLGKCGSRVVKRSASLPAWTLCYFTRQEAAIYLLTLVVTWLQCLPVDAEGSRLASFSLGNTHNEERRGSKQQQHGYSPCTTQVVWNYTAFHWLSHISANERIGGKNSLPSAPVMIHMEAHLRHLKGEKNFASIKTKGWLYTQPISIGKS